MRKLVLSSMMLLGGALASSYATASVIRCSSCQVEQHEFKAAAAGVGTHVVYDPVNADLTFWRVIKDRETGGLDVTQAEVPAAAMDAYLLNLELAYMPKDGANIGMTLTPGGWSSPSPIQGITNRLTNPISSFPNGNAYQVVNHATMRSQFAQAIASSLAGGNTGIDSFDSQLMTANSTLRSGAIPQTTTVTITVTVVWPDGSKSVFEVLPNNLVNLIPGRSLDPNGNPIPDWTMNTDGGTATYSGRYVFGNRNQMNSWVNQLIMYGIPITNSYGGRLIMSCVRVGSDSKWECTYI